MTIRSLSKMSECALVQRRMTLTSPHKNMKFILLTLACIGSNLAEADDYRYNLMVTTGLQERVFDKAEEETTIVFSQNSNAEARFILTTILELGGINGTKGMEQRDGAPFEQAIILKGKLAQKVLRTESAPNSAEAEDFQEFVLEGILIRFPLVRQRPGKLFDTAYLETHFSFDTLFPDGLTFKGKKVDLNKHTAK